ncbi:uncharacterized protein BO66DRAFT_473256 [Aspergillus aculeatinus CBS 121060]|uniref:Uncharacterized protein n=1 Tax=Aspergillus aculeatinus CBS 121060 TaxID=1448322 RepID=A0ACD1H2I8_9EURO|nr:hypothetical protein BO66DRAFT_473256 [Aspergillus aculeatinus CBS 121060]RAH67674.1 hypothetical protein BO66DRAFT_473256 [Aspergillus aculeatinus CBS 121060]
MTRKKKSQARKIITRRGDLPKKPPPPQPQPLPPRLPGPIPSIETPTGLARAPAPAPALALAPAPARPNATNPPPKSHFAFSWWRNPMGSEILRGQLAHGSSGQLVQSNSGPIPQGHRGPTAQSHSNQAGTGTTGNGNYGTGCIIKREDGGYHEYEYFTPAPAYHTAYVGGLGSTPMYANGYAGGCGTGIMGDGGGHQLGGLGGLGVGVKEEFNGVSYGGDVGYGGEDVKLFREEGKLFREDVKSFREDVKSFREEGKSFREEGKSFREEGKSFREEGKSFGAGHGDEYRQPFKAEYEHERGKAYDTNTNTGAGHGAEAGYHPASAMSYVSGHGPAASSATHNAGYTGLMSRDGDGPSYGDDNDIQPMDPRHLEETDSVKSTTPDLTRNCVFCGRNGHSTGACPERWGNTDNGRNDSRTQAPELGTERTRTTRNRTRTIQRKLRQRPGRETQKEVEEEREKLDALLREAQDLEERTSQLLTRDDPPVDLDDVLRRIIEDMK